MRLVYASMTRHIGVSNVTATQVAEAQTITEVVCVQNNCNLAHRGDEAVIDDLAGQMDRVRAPFFPLGGFSPLQSSTRSAVAKRLGWTPLQADPGTSSVAHLRENLAKRGQINEY